MQRCAQDTVERLLDISKTFERALIIAPKGFWDLVLADLPVHKQPKNIVHCYDGLNLPKPMISCADDALPFNQNSFDLVISILNLHSVNDLPGALLNIAHILAPDGLMLACYFGGASLTELRQSLYHVENETLGRISPRVSPMIDFSQSASLLQRAGFALPVIDTDRFTASYGQLSKLVSDLRDAGETNILTTRHNHPLSRSFYDALDCHLKSRFPASPERFNISFEILWATGWAPHESQQKPLKPGSAKIRLSEALGVKEQKL